MSATTKDIELADQKYQLTRFSARDGSWIVSQLLTRGLLMIDSQKADEKALGLFFAYALSQLPEDTYRKIQELCLQAARHFSGDVAMPLLMQDGRWADGSEPDLPTVTALIVSEMVFNLQPFFDPAAAKTMALVFPDLTQFAARSTATSSLQSSQGTGGTAT